MNFRTSLSIPPSINKICYSDPVVFMGSCFSDHIGRKLYRSKFQVLNNALGIVFNPVSLSRQLKYILGTELLRKEEFNHYNGLWQHFDFHGKFSGPDKEKVYAKIHTQIIESRSMLKKARYLFLTLGSSNVFINNDSGRVVANNHKFPIKEFSKHRLSIKEISQNLGSVFETLNSFNPDLQIVLTVSPVRYTRDGLVENTRSKASLILAIDELQTEFSTLSYFPAFEMFVDDLRDYRFYSSDLVHPNESGIQYVWELFKRCYFDQETATLEAEIDRIIKATEHRPIHPESELHVAFLQKLRNQMENLTLKHPFIDMKKELKQISIHLDQAL